MKAQRPWHIVAASACFAWSLPCARERCRVQDPELLLTHPGQSVELRVPEMESGAPRNPICRPGSAAVAETPHRPRCGRETSTRAATRLSWRRRWRDGRCGARSASGRTATAQPFGRGPGGSEVRIKTVMLEIPVSGASHAPDSRQRCGRRDRKSRWIVVPRHRHGIKAPAIPRRCGARLFRPAPRRT